MEAVTTALALLRSTWSMVLALSESAPLTEPALHSTEVNQSDSLGQSCERSERLSPDLGISDLDLLNNPASFHVWINGLGVRAELFGQYCRDTTESTTSAQF